MKSKSIASVSSLTDSFSSHAPKTRRKSSEVNSDNSTINGGVPTKQSLWTTLKTEMRRDEHFVSKFLVSGGCWCLFDIVVYGIGLFTGEIVHSILSPTTNISSNESVKMLTSRAMIVQALGVPATALAIVLLPYISLKNMQAYSFAALGVGCLVFGCSYYTLRANDHSALFALYCFLGFTMQCGVNVTSYVFPSLMFRKEVRSSFNGVAAAMGKSGAFIGAYLFPLVADHVKHGYAVVMIVCTMLCLLGAFITLRYCVPSMLNDIHAEGRLPRLSTQNSVRDALESARRFQQMETEKDNHTQPQRASENLRNSAIEMKNSDSYSHTKPSNESPSADASGQQCTGPIALGRANKQGHSVSAEDVEAATGAGGGGIRNPIQAKK